MSRLVWLVIACGLVLAPGFANDTKAPKQNRAADLLAARLQQKVKIDGFKIGTKSLTAVLGELAKHHDISFVLLEDEFKAKQINIKDKVSAVKRLDTDGLTVGKRHRCRWLFRSCDGRMIVSPIFLPAGVVRWPDAPRATRARN